MRFPHMLLTLFLLIVLGTANAQEQDRWSWEFRLGIDVPTEDLGDADLDTGIGVEGSILYQFRPDLSGYFGWGWDRFESDDAVLGQDADLEETGYNFGVQFARPIVDSSLNYFVRVGGIYNHLELESADGDIVADSGHGLGWQIGVGLQYSFENSWLLTPGIRYQSLSRDITVDGAELDVDLSYVEFGIGLSRSF